MRDDSPTDTKEQCEQEAALRRRLYLIEDRAKALQKQKEIIQWLERQS